MMYGSYLKYVNDRLFQVVKTYKVNQMIIPKKHDSKIDQQLLGLYYFLQHFEVPKTPPSSAS